MNRKTLLSVIFVIITAAACVPTEKEKIVEKEIVNTIEVEKPDSWWEQTQKKGFNTMLIALALVFLLKYISRKLL